MAKYLPNMVYCDLPVGRGDTFIPVPIKVEPAKKGTSFFRSRKHVEEGLRGECASCANALAGMDAKIGHLCISLDSRFISIDRIVKSKKGVHAIGKIWRSTQGKFQKQFDKNKSALLSSDQCEGVVTLYPYQLGSHAAGEQKPTGPKKRNNDPHSLTATRKGSLRRAKRSGVLEE
jgi:hypothetical protein